MIDKNTPSELRNQILLYQMSNVLTDRERAKLLGLPKGCRIRENAKIIFPEELQCGQNVYIGEGCIIDASGGLIIGNNTQFSAYVCVYTHSTTKSALFGNPIERKPSQIGSNCWFGSFSVVYPGVIIGDRVAVLPLSVVHKDVLDDSVVEGNPIGKVGGLEKRIKTLEKRIEDLYSG